MKDHIILKIIKITAYLQLLGGTICVFAIVLLYRGMGTRLINEGIVDSQGLIKLYIYIFISVIISFVLFYGIINLKNWARILLLFFCLFGLINIKSLFSPSIFSPMLPIISPELRVYIDAIKSVIFVLIDISLIYFLTRSATKKMFMPVSIMENG